MINFILPDPNYDKILMSFINPIIYNLNEIDYIITNKEQENFLNVHFFVEERYRFIKNAKRILLPHGIADKNYRNYESVKDFDYVFVSGELWLEKMVNQGLSKDKIFINGYTKMDNIFKMKPNKKDKPIVAWLPTHDGLEGVSSYPQLWYAVDNLSDDWYTAKSAHPARKSDNTTSENWLVDADVIIADSGSTIYEAWALNKPVVFPDWLVKEGISNVFNDTFEEYIYKNQIGYHANNMKELIQCIENALEYGITEEEKDFIEGIFPKELRGKSGKLTAEILINFDSEV